MRYVNSPYVSLIWLFKYVSFVRICISFRFIFKPESFLKFYNSSSVFLIEVR